MQELEDLAKGLKMGGCKGCWGGAGVEIGIGGWYGHGEGTTDSSDSRKELDNVRGTIRSKRLPKILAAEFYFTPVDSIDDI